MKRTFLIGIIIIITNQLPAQKYITAAGVRFSNEGFGLSLQQRIFEHTTIEAIGQINFKEVSATAMIEHHNNLLFTKSLNMYGGIGPSVGKYLLSDSSYVGCNLVFGVEYKVLLLPLVISADLKPAFKLQEDDWFHLRIGFSFRYVLLKQKNGFKLPFHQ